MKNKIHKEITKIMNNGKNIQSHIKKLGVEVGHGSPGPHLAPPLILFTVKYVFSSYILQNYQEGPYI
jgi:hypothetical protein